jgi:pimeloyl-ACP methyl ester carboxylesterase
MNEAFIGGIRIHYDVTGEEGSALLALNGKDSHMGWWHPDTVVALSAKNRLIRLDNRGSGKSEHPEQPYSIADMAADAVGLLDELGIAKAHVFGQSMGGMIAQEIAISYPERVDKLVLVATTCGVKRALPSWRMIQWLREKPGAFSASMTMSMLYSDAYLAKHPDVVDDLAKRMRVDPPNPKSMALQQLAAKSFDCGARLDKIQAPTLIIHGAEDWVFRPAHAKLLHRKIKGSKLVIVPGAGHGVFSQEAASVTEQIRTFVNG